MADNNNEKLDDIESKRRQQLEAEDKMSELIHNSDLASIKPSHYMKNSKLIKRILRLKTVLFDKETMKRVRYMSEHSQVKSGATAKKKKNKSTTEADIKDIFGICKEGYRENPSYRSTIKQSILRGSISGLNGFLQQAMMTCLTGAAAHNLPILGKLSESAARLTAFVGLAIPSIRGAMGDMVNTSYQIKAENLRNSVRSDTQFAKMKKLWEEYPMLFVKGNNHEELKAAIQTLSQEKGNILSQSSFFVGSLVSYVIAAGVIAYNNPTIAAMSMAVSAASGYAFSKAMKFFDQSAQRLKSKSTRYAGVMGDVMQHLGLVKQNNIGDNIDKKFSKAHQQELERTNALSKQRSKLVLRMQMALYAAVGLGTAIYASAYCQTPESAAIALGMTTSALTTLFGAIGVVNSSSNLRASFISYKAMADKLKVPEKMQIKEGQEKIPYRENNNTISVKNIRFVYPNLSDEISRTDNDGKSSLPQMDIDKLEFEAGKLQCVVGKSGNGKSTLINLLTHTYDVNQGEVKINGVNVQDTNQRELMEHICWQDQNSNFFETYTVKENMEIFIPSKEKMEWAEKEFNDGHMDERTYNHLHKLYEHPQEMIDEALKKAHVYDEYYSMREGKPTYDTQYSNLSKGQQQRLALARAFLSNRDIYIFDEPTDSLDPISTQQITETFKEMAKEGKNVIVITHSPQIMAQADQITVVENMHVTGNGRPEDLRASNDYLHGVFPNESDIYNFRAEAARSAHDEEAEHVWGKALNETRMAEVTLEDIRYYLHSDNPDIAEARMQSVIDKIKYLSDKNNKDVSSEKGTYIKIGEMISRDKEMYQFYLQTAGKDTANEPDSSKDKADRIRAYKEQARKDGVKETMDVSTPQSVAAQKLSLFISQHREVH